MNIRKTESRVRFLPLAALLLFAASSHAAEPIAGEMERQLLIENDQLLGEDDGYTSGISYGWSYSGADVFESHTPAWIRKWGERLYISRLADRNRAISYGVVQQIYTPSRTGDEHPDPGDRPYAGLLWWETSWHAFNETRSDRLLLELGLVGPASGAKQTQNYIHKLTGADKAQGWDEQLHTEPFFRVMAKRNYRLLAGSGMGTEGDVVGHLFGGLGNRRSELGTGISFRFGNQLARSLPRAYVLPDRDMTPVAGTSCGWCVFVSLGGAYVLNDLTIDGNTFQHSVSAQLKHWQAYASTGAELQLGHWQISLSYQLSSDEWEGQEDRSIYGSMKIGYTF